MKETGLKGNGIEGNKGVFHRAQKLKQQLKEMIEKDENIQNQLKESNRNKILLISHSELIKAVTSKSVKLD